MNNMLYPTELKIYGDVGNGACPSAKDDRLLLESEDALTVSVHINRSDYPKDQIVASLSEIFRKVLQYYG